MLKLDLWYSLHYIYHSQHIVRDWNTYRLQDKAHFPPDEKSESMKNPKFELLSGWELHVMRVVQEVRK